VSALPATALAADALWRENRRALADDLAARRLRARGRPTHLKLELTNYCNLACPMCPHPSMKREVGYMDAALLRRIVDEALPELEFVYLHHLGESIFHPRLGELVRHLRDRGVPQGLSTNATFLDGRRAHALLDNGLDLLVVSLDAATAPTYALMRSGGDFARTVGHVHELLSLHARTGAATVISLQLIVTDWNRGEASRFAEEWRAAGAHVMLKAPRDWAGQVSLPGHVREAAHAGPCAMPWTELTVMWDGAVVPCANFFEREHTVGDLSRQSLDEIWNGPQLRALRAAHSAGALDGVAVCSGCERHALEAGFVHESQLMRRLRTYAAPELAVRRGLS
jgi:radical SAM protein with 4Fe4S-binding SPASM domain